MVCKSKAGVSTRLPEAEVRIPRRASSALATIWNDTFPPSVLIFVEISAAEKAFACGSELVGQGGTRPVSTFPLDKVGEGF